MFYCILVAEFVESYRVGLVEPPPLLLPPLEEPPPDDVPLLGGGDDGLETLELLLAGGELLGGDGLETLPDDGRVLPDDCLDAGLLNSLLDLDDGVVVGW